MNAQARTELTESSRTETETESEKSESTEEEAGAKAGAGAGAGAEAEAELPFRGISERKRREQPLQAIVQTQPSDLCFVLVCFGFIFMYVVLLFAFCS